MDEIITVHHLSYSRFVEFIANLPPRFCTVTYVGPGRSRWMKDVGRLSLYHSIQNGKKRIPSDPMDPVKAVFWRGKEAKTGWVTENIPISSIREIEIQGEIWRCKESKSVIVAEEVNKKRLKDFFKKMFPRVQNVKAKV